MAYVPINKFKTIFEKNKLDDLKIFMPWELRNKCCVDAKLSYKKSNETLILFV